MKKPARQSIVASFGLLSQTASESDSESMRPDAGLENFTTPTPRVPAGVIGATQRTLSDIREERDRLQAIVDAGAGGIVELDSNIIDPSPFPDRLPDDDDAGFQEFKRSLAEDGQRIPVQVRRHPERPERYQIVYGHRRVRAARELGIAVKAIVRDLDDGELVVSQGLENASRQDLSWVERAVFARRMESAGIRARDIRGALSIDDAELAKMRSVWRTLPDDVIIAIGRAPKIGRPRWLELAAELAKAPSQIVVARETLSADKVRAEPSDIRFQMVLSAVSGAKAPLEKPTFDLMASDGQSVGKAMFGNREIRLKVEAHSANEFASFFRSELPELMKRFEASRRGR
ncbi:plasmid partitioning protein RepB [Bosea sp. RAF48]|uniref:plasmid partitioning protein RepB n=1 Tax=Bosea sp. RAF48 TaxID=3237480 RepID=UPI003F91B9A5